MSNALDTMSPYGHPKGVVDPNGNWILLGAGCAQLKLPIDYTLADAAPLFEVPSGTRLLVEKTFWEVTTAFEGGTASAIGLSSTVAPHETQGDLLGGAAGDEEADLVVGLTAGTAGASFAGGLVVLEAGTIIRFDRIVDAFTAGAGYAHIIGRFIR